MESQKISVIVPVYNIAEYLPRCLDSILAQTYSNIEIIAVNDGSQDMSGEVLDQYAEKYSNIKVIHQENAGVTAARLNGVRHATGEWIGFVDGDDYIEPNMYERLYNNAFEYHADISHCGYRMVFSDGRVHYFHNTGLLAKQDKITGLKELLSGARIEPGLCNKLFHKSLFQSLLHGDVMPMDIKINEDLLMNYYLFSAAENTVFEDWCPYHYIVRSASASRSKLNEHIIYDPIRVKQIILKDASDELKTDAQRAYVNTCVYTYCGLVMEKEYAVQPALKYIRSLLHEHADWCDLLLKRTKLLAKMIIHAPGLLRVTYPIYVRYMQKSKYS